MKSALTFRLVAVTLAATVPLVTSNADAAGPRLVADTFTATTANMTPADVSLRMQMIEWQEADARIEAVATLRPPPMRRHRSEAAHRRLRMAERKPGRLLGEVCVPRAARKRRRAHRPRHRQAPRQLRFQRLGRGKPARAEQRALFGHRARVLTARAPVREHYLWLARSCSTKPPAP